MSRPLRVFVAAVVAAGAAVLVALVPAITLTDLPGLASWFVLLLTAQLYYVASPTGGGVITGAAAISFATVLLYGPGAGALFAAVSAFLTNVLRRKVGPVKVIFNVSQLALSLGVAGLLYQALGGVAVPGRANSLYSSSWHTVFPVLLCFGTYFLLNTGLVATVIGLSLRTSPIACWRSNYLWGLPPSLTVPAVSYLFAVLYLRVGFFPVVALFAWLMLLTRSFRLITELHESHRRTLGMLASASAAGVPHLKGRSPRVAALGAKIAHEMGLSAGRCELVEYSGLLHNIGLLGVDRRVLLKQGPLETEEWRQVQGQVERGAAILEEVPSLRKVAEIVRCHRERPDGKGYPRGLVGSRIPLESRILHVASAFEAITTESPRQGRREPDEALAELNRGAGTMFDRTVIEALDRIARRGELAPAAGAAGGGRT